MKRHLAIAAALILIAPCATALAGFGHKMEITLDGYTKPTTLSDFPVLVKLNETLDGFEYSQFHSANGDDLRFRDSFGTELNYEVEEWNTAGDSYVWVQVPTLQGTNTKIEALWGNGALSKPAYSTDGSTWSSGYLGVYHLNGDAQDSTANANHGAFENGVTTPFAGQVAGGIDVAGGAHVDIGGGTRWDEIDNAHSHKFTMSAWVNPDTTGSDQTIIGRFGGQFLLWQDAGGGLQNYVFYDNGGPRTPEGSGTAAQQDQWQLVTAVGDGTLKLYVDGMLSGTGGTYSLGPNSDKISLGTESGDETNRALNGSLDEARIAAIARSEDWIWASWRSQSVPTEFATYGSVQLVPEPASFFLAGLGLLGLALCVRRRRR